MGGEGDAEAVENVEGYGKIITGYVSWDEVEAEDGVGATDSSGAQARACDGGERGGGAEGAVGGSTRSEGGEGGLEVAAGCAVEEAEVKGTLVIVIEAGEDGRVLRLPWRWDGESESSIQGGEGGEDGGGIGEVS